VFLVGGRSVAEKSGDEAAPEFGLREDGGGECSGVAEDLRSSGDHYGGHGGGTVTESLVRLGVRECDVKGNNS